MVGRLLQIAWKQLRLVDLMDNASQQSAVWHNPRSFEHLQMFRTHVSRNLCLEILEHARFIPQLKFDAVPACV